LQIYETNDKFAFQCECQKSRKLLPSLFVIRKLMIHLHISLMYRQRYIC